MALDLILMGPPGAGKGTQAGRIASERGLAHIATGDMLRAAVRDGTPLGLEAKAVMARGDLVSDDLIIAMFRERLGGGDTSAGVLLDGFPRTEAQAVALDDMLVGLDRNIAAVIVFDIDEETVVRRLSGRRMCRANDHVYHVESTPPAVEGVCDIDGSELYQRDDDKPEVIRTRFRKQWVKAAAPVIEYYRGHGIVSNIDAAQPREQVSEELDALLDGLGAAVVIVRKTDAEVDTMARAGRVVAATLDLVEERAAPGVTLAELDGIAETFIESRGGRPTFKGYRGYPGSICASPNAMVVHGIPGPYALVTGDLLSIDVGVTLGGYVADSAITFTIGEPSPQAVELIAACYEGLEAAIAQCQAGNRLGDVSHAVQTAVEAHGFGVVRSLVGHGVGRNMHEDPQIPNYGPPGRGPKLAPGMVLAIEPMITAGSYDVESGDDGWAVYTRDGSLAAHCEHTVAITGNGPRVLTRRDPRQEAAER